MPSLAVELWHLIIAGAGGISGLLFLYMRLKTIKDGMKGDAVTEALRRQDIENRITRLEKAEAANTEILSSFNKSLEGLKLESSQQHAELKDFVKEGLHKLESFIIKHVK